MEEMGRFADRLRMTRADYVEMAIQRMNREIATKTERFAALSRLVRGASMRVNAEFSAMEGASEL